MKKKILTLLAMILILSSTLGLAKENEKIDWLVEQKIVEGRILEDGSIDLALDENITRAEFTKVLVEGLNLEKSGNSSLTDIENHWAKDYINRAVNDPRNIIQGYEDRSFRPDDFIKFSELAAMLVRIVKSDLTDEEIKNAIWPDSYVTWAKEEGILDGIDIQNPQDLADRNAAFIMLYNSFSSMDKLDQRKTPGLKAGDIGKISYTILLVKEGDKYLLKFDEANTSYSTDSISPTKVEFVGEDGSYFLKFGFSDQQWKYLEGAQVEVNTGDDYQVIKGIENDSGFINVELKNFDKKISKDKTYTVDLFITPIRDILTIDDIHNEISILRTTAINPLEEENKIVRLEAFGEHNSLSTDKLISYLDDKGYNYFYENIDADLIMTLSLKNALEDQGIKDISYPVLIAYIYEGGDHVDTQVYQGFNLSSLDEFFDKIF